MPELFAAQAARTPDAVAVACDGRRSSYAVLAGRAARLARIWPGWGRGRSRCRGGGAAVGGDVAAVLGVMGSGAAYLPVDPSYPAARIAFMLADARRGGGDLHGRRRRAVLPPGPACPGWCWMTLASAAAVARGPAADGPVPVRPPTRRT